MERESEVGKFTRILVTLQHELSFRSFRIPELYTTIFRTGYDPCTVGRDVDREDVILSKRRKIRQCHIMREQTSALGVV